MDYLNIGSSPADEPCAQVGEFAYLTQARKECKALIAQLRRIHGDEPFGCRLAVKSFPHDFGTYLEVVCFYSNNIGMDYALKCEELPEKWDSEAKRELCI